MTDLQNYIAAFDIFIRIKHFKMNFLTQKTF